VSNMSDPKDNPVTPRSAPQGSRENMTLAPDPDPDAIVRHYRVDRTDGTLASLFREVSHPNPADKPTTWQEMDPLGRWVYNDRMRHYLQSGDADEISADESSQIAQTHFSKSLREYADQLKNDTEKLK
jgi:hypothetical protein